MPRDPTITHLFLAEVKDRKEDLKNQIKKYNKIFDRDVLNDYNLKFYCYQSVYKWKGANFGLVIADECHDSLTVSYSKFYKNNNYQALIGLSATINRNTYYKLKNGIIVSKGDILDKYMPIVYKYGMKDSKKNKTSRELMIHVLPNTLDNSISYIKAGNNKKRFFQTELKAYNFWDNQFKKAMFIENLETRELKIGIAASKRSNILYNSLNKIKSTKQLLESLKNKTIIFSNNLDSLLKVTPNVVSSRNKDDENNRIKEAFNTDKIKVIASFKKLKQGTNLEGLDNVVLMSYYSVALDFIQRIGRLRDNGKKGNVFIFLTKNTQEEVWFTNMLKDFNNLTIKYYETIEECIKNIKNET